MVFRGLDELEESRDLNLDRRIAEVLVDFPQFDGHSNKPVEDELGGIQCQPNDNSTRGNTRSKRFV
jgi:hypothetical protein